MSKFLAPIHSWLFNKIRIQEELVSLLGKKSGETSIKEGENLFGLKTPKGNLEVLIDTTNIHGWLQERITSSERRTAHEIKTLLDNGIKEEEIGEIFKSHGKNLGSKMNVIDAPSAYKIINDTVVDGMPCDMVNRIISQDENAVIYEATKDVHSGNAEAAGLNPMIFRKMREYFLEGLIEGLGLNVNINDNVYTISK